MSIVYSTPVATEGLRETKQQTGKMTMSGKLVTVTCKAFGGRIGTHTCSVDADGTVRVWDRIAGHYTLCHSLTPRSLSRIRSLAKTRGADRNW